MHKKHSHHGYWGGNQLERTSAGFECINCETFVTSLAAFSGVQNRNHCPNCLASRHMDWQEAGDRMSACKAIMVPVGLSMKWNHNKYARLLDGELMLVHFCMDCGKVSVNRIAADDRADRLQDLYRASQGWIDELSELVTSGFRLLSEEDSWLIDRQLFGFRGN